MDGSAMLANRQRVFSLLVLLLSSVVYSATASASSVIVGGSNLLTQSSADQLATWLGEGDLKLTNIFTHSSNDATTSYDFHAAADGKGRTFVVAEVTNVGTSKIIVGGYNPQAWDSVSGYHTVPNTADRTAFLFNLTTPSRLDEKSLTAAPDPGQYQTSNQANSGPYFGAGADFLLYTDLNSGTASQYSYGDNGETVVGTGTGGAIPLKFDRLEIFTIADVAPLPSTALVGFVLLGGFALTKGRRRQIET